LLWGAVQAAVPTGSITVEIKADWSRPKVTGDIKLFVSSDCTASRTIQDLIGQSFSNEQKQKVKTYYLFNKNKLQNKLGNKKEDFFQACLQQEHPALYWEYLSVELRSLTAQGKHNQLMLKGISSQKPYQICMRRTEAEHLKQKYVIESFEYQDQYHFETSPILMLNNQVFYRDKNVKILNIPIFNNPKIKEYLKLKGLSNKTLGACELKDPL